MARLHKTRKTYKKRSHKQTMRALTKRLKRLPPTIILIFFYTALVLVTATIAATIAINSRKTQPLSGNTGITTPFTEQQRAAIPFKLYYPSELPDSLYIDLRSISIADANIITMRIADKSDSLSNRALTISQQSLPANFNAAAFNSGLENKTTVETDFGEATLGTVNLGRTQLGMLITSDKTLLLFQAEAGLSNQDLSFIVRHVKPSPSK